MKIAIVTDSNSGITQAQAGELGIFVLPMPFMINEATFEEDINLTHEEFYKRQAEDADITTSQHPRRMSPISGINCFPKVMTRSFIFRCPAA